MKALMLAHSKFQEAKEGSKEKARQAIARVANQRFVIRGAHAAAKVLFAAAGFKFETRVQGDLQLGLIRHKLKTVKGPRPHHRPVKRAVFVPGFGDTPLSWMPVLVPLKPVLARDVEELVIIDFPGFGGFMSDGRFFDSMDSLLAFFRETMDTLNPEILMGHSLGGWLTADYVSTRPVEKQPSKLILIDPSGIAGSEQEKEIFRTTFESAIAEGFSKLRPHVFSKEPFWFKWIAHEFQDFIQMPEIQSFVRSIRDDHLLDGRLGPIASQTWVLWGEKDTLTPASWLNKWITGLKHVDAKGALVRGSGHSPQVEKPGVVIALLTQIFIGRGPVRAIGRPFWTLVN